MVDTPNRTERWTKDQLQRAVDSARIALWSWKVDTDFLDMDEYGCRLWDVVPDGEITFEELSEKIHPVDRERVRAAFVAMRETAGHFEIDFRTSINSKIRWISARGCGNEDDIINKVMVGVFLDITDRKLAEERNELFAGEMSHRVKNLLSIASGLARITSRSAADVNDMASQLVNRLGALGRAHNLVRPFSGEQQTAALLKDIFTVLLQPYQGSAVIGGNITIEVPPIAIGEHAATSLALVVHELATNSLKYGALSANEGELAVSGSLQNDRILITWTEKAGPAVDLKSDRQGYGKKLVKSTVEGALGGTIEYDWLATGLVVRIDIKASNLET